jgi:hypothetical protein
MSLRYEPCPRCREKGNDTRGDNLVLYADGSGHCFACAYHKFPKHYTPKRETIVEHKTLLPRDFTREVPAAALRWLLQWGLPYTYWKDQIGFSPKENRLVFLVGNPLQFSIGRYVGTSPPEFEGAKAPRKWYVWGDPHRHCEVVKPSSNASGSKQVVLVEDWLSANKVAAAGHTCIPLFGVEVYKPTLYYLMQKASSVLLWLDKDQAGSIMRKAAGLQSVLNIPVSIMITEKDPKALSFSEIRNVLTS